MKLAKIGGIQNFAELYNDIKEVYRGKQEWQEAIMNWDDGSEYLKKQKEFNPGKRDFVYELATRVLTGKRQRYLPVKNKKPKSPGEFVKDVEEQKVIGGNSPEFIKD